MKFLLVSDAESKYIWDHFDKSVFSDVELILSCGDLSASYLEFLVTMIGAPLYYVPGNHDTKFDREPPGGCENADGRLLEHKGIRILGLGGCRSPRREVHQYPEEDMAKRVKNTRGAVRKAGGFDILLSHAPAFGLGDGDDTFHLGFECFVTLLDTYRPKYHFFGHQHKSYRADSGPDTYKNTRLINGFGYKFVEY